jgi:phosphoribosylformimino-5-aminoimidazole carboxamide ribotide isomerase
VQLGGGVRDAARVQELLDCGAVRVAVGTRALLEPAWLAEITHRFPERIVLAADVRGRQLTTHGWSQVLARSLEEALADWEELSLAGLLVTSVEREGLMQGPDVEMLTNLRQRTRHALYASGGIGTEAHLTQLEEMGMDAAIVGMALYTGVIQAETAAEFGR